MKKAKTTLIRELEALIVSMRSSMQDIPIFPAYLRQLPKREQDLAIMAYCETTTYHIKAIEALIQKYKEDRE